MNLRVDKGDPTPEELAALVTVLLSVRPSSISESPAVSCWWRSGLPVRRPGWAQSGLPRMSQW